MSFYNWHCTTYRRSVEYFRVVVYGWRVDSHPVSLANQMCLSVWRHKPRVIGHVTDHKHSARHAQSLLYYAVCTQYMYNISPSTSNSYIEKPRDASLLPLAKLVELYLWDSQGGTFGNRFFCNKVLTYRNVAADFYQWKNQFYARKLRSGFLSHRLGIWGLA